MTTLGLHKNAVGGFFNRSAEEGQQDRLPIVGEPCTEYLYSDRRVWHVTEVKSPKLAVIREAKVTKTTVDGYQTTEPDPDGFEYEIKLKTRKGVRRWMMEDTVVRLGVAEGYRDPYF